MNSCLIELNKINRDWYWKPSQLSRTSVKPSLGGECAVVILLHQYNSRPHPTHLPSYIQVSGVLVPPQGNFFLQ